MKRVLMLGNLLVLSFLWGCASTTPTQYYSLNAGQLEATNALSEQVSLGVLAVKIPDQLERAGLVSRKGTNELTVSSYHIWAGDLDENISAFLTDVLAQRLGLNDVRSVPWNTNLRPEYQLEANIDQFSGQLNGEVVLKASYSFLKDKGQTQVLARRFNLSTKASGSYASYVDSLNDLMLEFSDELARQIQGELGKQ